MNDFTDGACGRQLDPRKRVNYTLGMILGEDEFDQEQAYLRARDHLGVRALHGYGTVCGLRVSWNTGAGRVEVAPGLAVDPAGRFVCVPVAQCADLGEWLTAHRGDLAGGAPASLPDAASVYVVLCYRECETDTVPVPSETCRTGDESMAASRVLESFELRLLLAPPTGVGEVAGDALPAAVDRLLAVLESVPVDSLADVDVVRRELVAWATEARPEATGNPCLSAPPDNCGDRPGADSTAVLLARIDVDLEEGPDGRLGVVGDPAVHEDERPVLLSTRFLQEWLIALLLHRELITPSLIEDHNALQNLAAGDVHTQYLPADGSRPLTGDLDAGGRRLTELGPAVAPRDAVRVGDVVGADLGPRPGGGALRVVQLQDRPVEAENPNAGDALVFDGTAWRPAPVAGAQVLPVLPFVTVELMGRREGDRTATSYLLWFHLWAPANDLVLEDLEHHQQFVVHRELCDAGVPGLETLDVGRARAGRTTCNVFKLEVATSDAGDYLRLDFFPRRMAVQRPSTGERFSVARWARDAGFSWLGSPDGGVTVTAHVLHPSPFAPFEGFKDVVDVPPPVGGPNRLSLSPVP